MKFIQLKRESIQTGELYQEIINLESIVGIKERKLNSSFDSIKNTGYSVLLKGGHTMDITFEEFNKILEMLALSTNFDNCL